VICSFTRTTELFPSKTKDTAAAAQAMLEIFCRYGVPRYVRADGAGQFSSSGAIKAFYELTGITTKTTLPYHPSSNGMVERANAEISKHARAILYDNNRPPATWLQDLPLVRRILNSSYHSSIGCSPHELLWGGRGDLDRGLFRGSSGGDAATSKTATEWLADIRRRPDEYELRSIKHLEKVDQKKKDKEAKKTTKFEKDELVLVEYARRMGKLTPRRMGPYRVVRQTGNVVTLTNLITNENVNYPAERLRLFDSSRTPDLVAEAGRDQQEWHVREVIDHHLVGYDEHLPQDQEYHVRWHGYDDAVVTIETFEALKDTEALQRYIQEKDLGRPRKSLHTAQGRKTSPARGRKTRG
jgi:hypothetical protein